MRPLIGWVAAGLAFLLATAPARAVVVVSNLTDPGAGVFNVTGLNNSNEALANLFTTGSGMWEINSVTVRFSDNNLNAPPDDFSLSIRLDNAGAPGAVVGTFDTSVGDVIDSADYTYLATAPFSLSGNTSYFLTALPTDPDASYSAAVALGTGESSGFGWTIADDNTQSQDGGSSWFDNTGSAMIFSLDATLTAVPEPGSLALLALVGAGLGVRRRKSGRMKSAG